MKKLLFILTIFLSVNISAQNLYFAAFKNINKAKRLLKTDPQQADRLFIEAYSYLKQYVNKTLKNNKPSANSFKLLGEMFLNGWGVDKDINKAVKLLCAAKKLGNIKANNIIKKNNITCPEKINYKELKQ
jgi:TPR repeat protein